MDDAPSTGPARGSRFAVQRSLKWLSDLGRPPIAEWRGPSLCLADLEKPGLPPGARIAAAYVAYHPDGGFPDRVGATLEQVDHVYVVDNTPAVNEFAFDGRVTVVRNMRNAGVGAAFDQAASRASADGFDYLLLMNQQDAPRAGMVDALLDGIRRWPGRAAIIAPVRADRNMGLRYTPEDRGRIWPVLAAGAAGSLLDLRAYEGSGPFRVDLFIDQVDHEYCLRLRHNGYDIVQTGDAVVETELGSGSPHTVAGLTLVTTGHSPLRRYYITRNRLIVAREYPDFPQYRRIARDWTIREIRNVILFEKRRPAKLFMAARGVWDYLRGKTGPLKGG